MMEKRSWVISDPVEEAQREREVPRSHSRREGDPRWTEVAAPCFQSGGHGGCVCGVQENSGKGKKNREELEAEKEG